MESLFRQTGISINCYDPWAISTTSKEAVFECKNYSSYDHEIAAMGGFVSANITIPMKVLDAELWYEKGLGRRVKTFNQGGRVIWQGFVNEINVGNGASSLHVGPMSGIGNLVGAVFTPIDFTYYPPVVGSETVTTLVPDEISQATYGKWEKWISAGQAEWAAAEQIRDVYLADMAYPQSSDYELSVMSKSNTSVTLTCVGDLYWLTAYIYNNLVDGVDTLLTKLQLILDADPNGVINHDYDYMEDNVYLVGLAENRNRYAWDIIKELLSLGNDTDDSRRLFGIYEDGLVRYSTIPTAVEYYHYLGDKSRKITTTDNALVPPWDVVAGKWLKVPDFMTLSAFNAPTSLKQDMRNKFLESVKYTAPYGLDLSGGRNDKLSQMLAKISYSGGYL